MRILHNEVSVLRHIYSISLVLIVPVPLVIAEYSDCILSFLLLVHLKMASGTVTEPQMSSGYTSTFPDQIRAQLGSREPSSYGTSIRASANAYHLPGAAGQTYFRSRRIKDVSTISKPWTEQKDPRKKWHTILPVVGLVLGFALVGIEAWRAWVSVINHDYCLILDEDFSTGTLNENIWTKEVQVGGFGYVCSIPI